MARGRGGELAPRRRPTRRPCRRARSAGVPVSFLGYDPGRVTTLRRRLDELADEAAGLRFGDVAAAEAADAYQRAVRLMTDWRHDLAAISSCAFDSPFRPVALRGMEF